MPANGNMFEPARDPGDEQPQQGALGQMMPGAAAQPMQPPQSPEEHAQTKQGWMDFFKDPSTSAFLMQFGASMLQPNVRGFGAQLGQSLGEGGAAVGRMQEMSVKQQEQEAQAEELKGRGAYYAAEGQARPAEARAALLKSQADWKNALTNAAQLPIDQQKLAIQQELGQTKLALQAAGVDNATINLQLKQQQIEADNALKAAQAELAKSKAVDPITQARIDKYFAAVTDYYQQGGEKGLGAFPDYTKYGLTPEQAGQIAAPTTGGAPTVGGAPTTGTGTQPQQGGAAPVSTLPDYQDTPSMRKFLDEATPAKLFEIGQEYMKRGMSPAQWEQIKVESMKRKQAAAGQ